MPTEITVVHSAPVWVCDSNRPQNPRFGGGSPNFFGNSLVIDRLGALRDLSDRLIDQGIIRQPLLTSGHSGLEFMSEIPRCPANKANAIPFANLETMIAHNKSPMVNAITAPAFGYPGSERGAMLSTKSDDYLMAESMHTEAIKKSLLLKEKKLGLGRCIWWPAYASWTQGNQWDQKTAWELLVDFWVKILEKAPNGATMHLEFKPGDPGIDYINTPVKAIAFCQEVNRRLGRTAMLLNNELAHWLMAGYTALEMFKMTIESGLFDGFFHANSGQKLPFKLDEWLEQQAASGKEVHPYDTPILMDYDLLWGTGSPSVVKGQQMALAYLKNESRWAGQLVVEHDIHPNGMDPYKAFFESISNFETMWAAC